MSDYLAEIVAIIAVLGLTVLFVLGVASCTNRQDTDKWNNGYHTCGGKWVYEQAVGHRITTGYIYSCDKCGQIEEFEEWRAEVE